MIGQKKSPTLTSGAAVSTLERAASAFDNQQYTGFGAESQDGPDLAGLLGEARDAEARWQECKAAGDVAGAAHWRCLQFEAQAQAWAMGARP